MRVTSATVSLALLVGAVGCQQDRYTSARITVWLAAGAPPIDQLRFAGSHEGTEVFAPTLRPPAPHGPLAGEQSVVVIIDDALADSPQPALLLAVAGLSAGSEVAWGSAAVSLTRGAEADADVTLGTGISDGGEGDGGGDGGALVITTTALPDATFGSPYGAQLSASGGVAPYLWSMVAGTLPSGLALSHEGILIGTPLVAGSSTFSVEVAGSDGHYATQTLTLAVSRPGAQTLTLLSRDLLHGNLATPYEATISASGGIQPYAFGLAAGALPSGLSLSVEGVLAGTPTAAGESVFIVQASDSSMPSQAATAATRLIVDPPGGGAALSVGSVLLPAAKVGVAYATTLSAQHGTPPYVFSLAGAAPLPAGLMLSTDGTLAGRPIAAGDYSIAVAVSDRSLPSQAATRVLTLNVADSVVGASLSITTGSLPSTVVGAVYTNTITGSGGTEPYTFSLAGGALPPGLTLTAAGVLAGKPTTAGAFTLTVGATDASLPPQSAARSFTLTVAPAPGGIDITTAALPDGTVGAAYQFTLVAAGGAPPYAWSLAAGSLPNGLSLGGAGGLTGTLGAAGNFTFTVLVRDAQAGSAARQFAIAVAPARQSLSVTNVALPDGTAGAAYAAMLGAAGGTQPYGWSITGGALPAGVMLNAATGALTGTPAAPGSFAFTVTVADSSGPPQAAARVLSIFVHAPPNQLAIQTTLLPPAQTHVAYSTTLSATGGAPPYLWQIDKGSLLPQGMMLVPMSGVIAGAPMAPGTYSFTIVLSDSTTMPLSAKRTFTLSVIDAALAVQTMSLPDGVVNVPYNGTLSASGGTPGYMWTIAAGNLPNGLNIGPNGTINGKPRQVNTFNFTVLVRDSGGAMAQRPLSITVN